MQSSLRLTKVMLYETALFVGISNCFCTNHFFQPPKWHGSSNHLQLFMVLADEVWYFRCWVLVFPHSRIACHLE